MTVYRCLHYDSSGEESVVVVDSSSPGQHAGSELYCIVDGSGQNIYSDSFAVTFTAPAEPDPDPDPGTDPEPDPGTDPGDPDPEPVPGDPAAVAVAEYLGQGDDPAVVALAGHHLPVVRALVYGYTRGRGFDGSPDRPAEDVAFVIRTATARSVSNPEALRAESVGSLRVDYPAVVGYTLPELAVLHRHRRRAL